MRIHLLQHSKAAPAGSVSTWLKEKNIPYELHRLYLGDEMPAVSEVDWLIALGGEMSALDEKQHPFMVEEKKLIAALLQGRGTYLGICLGAQILADVLGAKIHTRTCAEKGWYPVELDSGAIPIQSRPARETLTLFSNHQDVFDLPKGATLFAHSQHCPNHGFGFEDSFIGLQFHPNSEEKTILKIAEEQEKLSGQLNEWQQSAEEIKKGLNHLSLQKEWLEDLLASMYARTLLK